MIRAKTVSFTSFTAKANSYCFDYLIDNEPHSITLSHSTPSPLDASAQTPILFNLGMCYLIDLAELVVPDVIEINFSLNPNQLSFWQSLYQEVAQEKMYLYHLDLILLKATWKINSQDTQFSTITLSKQNHRALCLTGGKESLTLLKLLKNQDDLLLFFLNPEMNVHRQKVYEKVKNQFTTVKTISNRHEVFTKLKAKHQTSLGSGVDMAHLIFNTMLLNCRYVMIGNEYSSNYPNLMYQGYMINHQYIKSIYFAQKINHYIHDTITSNFSYHSPFFGLYEIKIAEKLFVDEEFLDVWTSCNHTTPEKNFCSNCAKCAFTYLVSLVHTSETFLSRYFSRDLLQDVALFKPLQDFTGEKPLDCVGEKIEVWTALNLLTQHPEYQNKPVVRYFNQNIKPFIADQLSAFQKEVSTLQTTPTSLPPELAELIAKNYNTKS